jgi:hypothetical protein
MQKKSKFMKNLMYDFSNNNAEKMDMASGFDGLAPITLSPKKEISTLRLMPTSQTLGVNKSLGININSPISKLPRSTSGSSTVGCDKDLSHCPDGTILRRDPNNNCQFPSCSTTTNGSTTTSGTSGSNMAQQQYYDSFSSAYGVNPTSTQLQNFIYLWGALGYRPSAEEFNCYVTTGNPVCTAESTQTSTSTGASTGGDSGEMGEQKKGEEGKVEAETVKVKTPWLLYGGIAATAVGVIGYLFIKK